MSVSIGAELVRKKEDSQLGDCKLQNSTKLSDEMSSWRK
jgi:hypothetical protein